MSRGPRWNKNSSEPYVVVVREQLEERSIPDLRKAPEAMTLDAVAASGWRQLVPFLSAHCYNDRLPGRLCLINIGLASSGQHNLE